MRTKVELEPLNYQGTRAGKFEWLGALSFWIVVIAGCRFFDRYAANIVRSIPSGVNMLNFKQGQSSIFKCNLCFFHTI